MLEIDSTHFYDTIDAKFTKIGRVELKIWIKQVSNLFCKFKSKNATGYIRGRHLALSDSMVPLHADRCSGPLDLSEDRCTGFKVTPSVSHRNRALDLRSDGREKDRGRAHREKVDGEGLAALEITARWF
jgi:hypothetical protein